jgi:hypothetical protein
MAETGIMGSSGEFRTNQTSKSNPAGEAAQSGMGKVADAFARRRQMSHEQFMGQLSLDKTKIQEAAKLVGIKYEGKARVKVVKAEGKQTRKNATTFGELKSEADMAAKKSGVARTEIDFGTGKTMTQFKEPRTRQPRTTPAAAPAAPATTRMPTKYSARNPHPKNPFEAGTKEHKGYNSATGSQRAAMTRRSKQGMK